MPTDELTKAKYFPLKPACKEGFKEPVSWFGGRELIVSIKAMIVYSLFGEQIDPRSWMKPNIHPNTDEANVNNFWAKKVSDYWEWKRERFQFWDDYLKDKNLWTTKDDGTKEIREFWFDYISDTGDGQTGVYGVGCLCMSDLWLEEDKVDASINFRVTDSKNEILLPRGSFLFIGGDTAYHVADYSAIHERFQLPFRWAFESVRKFMRDNLGLKADAEKFFFLDKALTPITHKDWDGMMSKKTEGERSEHWDSEPLRPIFAVPANHDYYDDIGGFNRQFRRPPLDELDERNIESIPAKALPLKIPTFQREQEASYTALQLPFGWWMFSIDSENEKLDFRQKKFFNQIVEKHNPKKLIIATPEPTTVFGKQFGAEDKTARAVSAVLKNDEQPFLKDGELKNEECRLDLSGDVHHYARYWGPKDEKDESHYASVVSGGGGAFFHPTETLIGTSTDENGKKVCGEIPPTKVFPSQEKSRNRVADRIFDLHNIKKGGYIQIAGAVIAIILFMDLNPLQFDALNDICSVDDFLLHVKEQKAIVWMSFVVLLVVAVAFVFSGSQLHSLVKTLKEKRHTDDKSKDDGRISQLRKPLLLFLVGVFVYLFGFLWAQVITPNSYNLSMYGSSTFAFWLRALIEKFFLIHIHDFAQSFLLLLHLVIVGLIVWLSIEYSNWLGLRFKYARNFGERPDHWVNVIPFIGERFYQKAEEKALGKSTDSEIDSQGFLRRLWILYTKSSVVNVPTIVLNVLAILVLVIGIYYFGNRSLALIGADLIFIVVAIGGFFGIVAFAVSSGAQYLRGAAKIPFVFLGLWHALLQLAAPLLLIKSDWRFLIFVWVLIIFANGLSTIPSIAKFVFQNLDNPSESTGKEKKLWKTLNFRGGAWLMKKFKRNAWGLFVVWILYGLLILLPTLFIQNPKTIPSLVGGRESWFAVFLAILLVGYLGYRMTRVWFGWYLAVSLAFNGHNNEAGGAARTEDFKQILRIKLTEDAMTVYVIGFEQATINMLELSPKLVDKFTLTRKKT
jgi:hypothetical protein